MAVRTIRTVPDPVLRNKAKRVKAIDKSVKKLIADMQETLRAAQGAGLAAPQVGESLRLIVLSIPEEDKKKCVEYVVVNPEIIKRKGERVVKEGCLSIPGYIGEIKRSQQVKVKGLDASGKEIRFSCGELLGQALEHEIDHLNGVLYVDHLESQDKLEKLEPPEKDKSESRAAKKTEK